MDILLLIAAVIVAGLAISLVFKGKTGKVDMNHKAPNVHNVQMKGRVGPPTAADKAKEEPAKKVVKKKTTKKKTSKKTASKKAEK